LHNAVGRNFVRALYNYFGHRGPRSFTGRRLGTLAKHPTRDPDQGSPEPQENAGVGGFQLPAHGRDMGSHSCPSREPARLRSWLHSDILMPGKVNALRYGGLGPTCMHLCVDMQRLFAEDTAWRTPWMARVIPLVAEITAAHAERTVFTRFIPFRHPGEASGTWRKYYERWSSMTVEQLGRDMVGLVAELARFVPPASVFDKHVYSPWHGGNLHVALRGRAIDTLVITGGETDVCVLATVLGAVDYGYRVVIATDALCSSSDETHDALLKLYELRFSEQVEAVTTEVVLRNWA
jgi:nicotinamidase-related amidase